MNYSYINKKEKYLLEQVIKASKDRPYFKTVLRSNMELRFTKEKRKT